MLDTIQVSLTHLLINITIPHLANTYSLVYLYLKWCLLYTKQWINVAL